MLSLLQKKHWKLSASSAFCLVFLSSGLLLLLIHAALGQQPQMPVKLQPNISNPQSTWEPIKHDN